MIVMKTGTLPTILSQLVELNWVSFPQAEDATITDGMIMREGMAVFCKLFATATRFNYRTTGRNTRLRYSMLV